MAGPAVVSGRRMYAVSHCHYPYNTEVFRVFFYLPPLTSIRYISMFFFFTEVVSEPCQAQAGLLVSCIPDGCQSFSSDRRPHDSNTQCITAVRSDLP